MHHTSILTHEMTIIVLYDLQYSVWHRILQRLTFSLILGSRYHIWIIASISWALSVQFSLQSRSLIVDHKFSIGMRSGEFP